MRYLTSTSRLYTSSDYKRITFLSTLHTKAPDFIENRERKIKNKKTVAKKFCVKYKIVLIKDWSKKKELKSFEQETKIKLCKILKFLKNFSKKFHKKIIKSELPEWAWTNCIWAALSKNANNPRFRHRGNRKPIFCNKARNLNSDTTCSMN